VRPALLVSAPILHPERDTVKAAGSRAPRDAARRSPSVTIDIAAPEAIVPVFRAGRRG
jgi:hypothetical protein